MAIRADGLTKEYNVGRPVAGYLTLREQLSFRRLRSAARDDGSRDTKHKALDGVSFDVGHGETVGIVGANGAGKTTLLKVLSRITSPTAGRAEVTGRIGCLLEAGAGFHPELTGRENVYLSGIILGMTRAQIRAKFDEIVAFAEVEKFLDTPVKRYSSGMFVRLGFAVAVHLEPEILIVDEVLAVGDAEFQRKCFAKINQVGREHRTVLFVSHNMAAMRSICERAILLRRGKIVMDGPAEKVLDAYQASVATGENDWEPISTSNYIVEAVHTSNPTALAIKTFEPLEIRVRMRARRTIGDPGLYVGFLTSDGQRVAGLDFKDFTSIGQMAEGDTSEFVFSVPNLPLLPGRYTLEIHTKDMATLTIEPVAAAYAFDVAETPVYGGRQLDRWFGTVGFERATAAGHRVS